MKKIDSPIVSIIIPTYNRARTIVRSVNSILSQTFQNFELIIVDDCSTDNTKDILEKTFNDSRIIYYKLKNNSGACAARNKGIELAKGKYIAFQDSDDEWLCEKLEKQIQILDNSIDCQAIFCQFIRINNTNISIMPSNSFNKNNINSVIFEENFLSTQTLLVKKEVFKKIGIFDISLPRFQDWELAIRLITKCKVFYQEEPLVIMYIQNDSISKNIKAKAKALEIIVNKYKDYYIKHPLIYSKYLRRISLLNYLFVDDGNIANQKSILLFKSFNALKMNITNYRNWLCFLFILFPLPFTIKKRIVKSFLSPDYL